MMVTLFLEEKEEAKFRKKLETEEGAKQQPTTTLVQDISAAPSGEEVNRTLGDMELSLEICTGLCPHCGNVNIFAGFEEMIAYTCQECGRAVETGNS